MQDQRRFVKAGSDVVNAHSFILQKSAVKYEEGKYIPDLKSLEMPVSQSKYRQKDSHTYGSFNEVFQDLNYEASGIWGDDPESENKISKFLKEDIYTSS